MALKDFSNVLFFKTLEDPEEVLGTFTVTPNTELEHIRLLIVKYGTLAGSETFNLTIHGSKESDSPIYTSDNLLISDITDIGTYWLGWVRFDFDRVNLNMNHEYQLRIESTSYTRNADAFFIGVALNWPETYNIEVSTNSVGPAMQVFGYREIT